MPNYKGHLCGGFIAYVLVVMVFVGTKVSLLTAGEWLLATLAGALFPDIDVKSKGQKYFYYVVLLLFLFLLYQGRFQVLSCVSFIAITPMLSRHRGIFHEPWFLIVMPMFVWAGISVTCPHFMRPLLMHVLFFIAGAMSHVFLDRMMSKIRS